MTAKENDSQDISCKVNIVQRYLNAAKQSSNNGCKKPWDEGQRFSERGRERNIHQESSVPCGFSSNRGLEKNSSIDNQKSVRSGLQQIRACNLVKQANIEHFTEGENDISQFPNVTTPLHLNPFIAKWEGMIANKPNTSRQSSARLGTRTQPVYTKEVVAGLTAGGNDCMPRERSAVFAKNILSEEDRGLKERKGLNPQDLRPLNSFIHLTKNNKDQEEPSLNADNILHRKASGVAKHNIPLPLGQNKSRPDGFNDLSLFSSRDRDIKPKSSYLPSETLKVDSNPQVSVKNRVLHFWGPSGVLNSHSLNSHSGKQFDEKAKMATKFLDHPQNSLLASSTHGKKLQNLPKLSDEMQKSKTWVQHKHIHQKQELDKAVVDISLSQQRSGRLARIPSNMINVDQASVKEVLTESLGDEPSVSSNSSSTTISTLTNPTFAGSFASKSNATNREHKAHAPSSGRHDSIHKGKGNDFSAVANITSHTLIIPSDFIKQIPWKNGEDNKENTNKQIPGLKKSIVKKPDDSVQKSCEFARDSTKNGLLPSSTRVRGSNVASAMSKFEKRHILDNPADQDKKSAPITNQRNSTIQQDGSAVVRKGKVLDNRSNIVKNSVISIPQACDITRTKAQNGLDPNGENARCGSFPRAQHLKSNHVGGRIPISSPSKRIGQAMLQAENFHQRYKNWHVAAPSNILQFQQLERAKEKSPSHGSTETNKYGNEVILQWKNPASPERQALELTDLEPKGKATKTRNVANVYKNMSNFQPVPSLSDRKKKALEYRQMRLKMHARHRASEVHA